MLGTRKVNKSRSADYVPVRLGEAGMFLWEATTENYRLRADELLLLEQACREADLIDELFEDLRFASSTSTGSQGQEVAHPLLAEIRQHRTLYGQLIHRLNLPDLDEAGDGSGLRSVPDVNQNRAAGMSRWAKSHGKAS